MTRLTVARWRTDGSIGHVDKGAVAQRDVGSRIPWVRGARVLRKDRQTCLVSLDDVECTIIVEVDALGDVHRNRRRRITSKERIRCDFCSQQDEGCERCNREHDENKERR